MHAVANIGAEGRAVGIVPHCDGDKEEHEKADDEGHAHKQSPPDGMPPAPGSLFWSLCRSLLRRLGWGFFWSLLSGPFYFGHVRYLKSPIWRF
jgi:hypothetical protein